MSKQIEAGVVSEEISMEELQAVLGGKDKTCPPGDGDTPPPTDDGDKKGGTGVPGT